MIPAAFAHAGLATAFSKTWLKEVIKPYTKSGILYPAPPEVARGCHELKIAREVMAGMDAGKPYPSDVSDEEWEFVAPYLTLLPLDAGQRNYPLREVFNACML